MSSAGLLAGWLISGVIGSALVAVAWYGFAARRLLTRLCPLATGLLIGVAQWILIVGITRDPGSLADSFLVIGLAGSAATGVAGVWVVARSDGGLLPVWLMQTLLVTATTLAFFVVVPDLPSRSTTFDAVFTAIQVAVALVLVVAGRMWRRPATLTEPSGGTGLSLS
jgi:hypothetical protein